MKRVTTVTAIVIVVLVLGWDAVEFAGGYNAFPIVIGFLPAALFLFALMLVATLASAVVMLIALFRRHIGYAAVLAAVVFGCWVLSPWFVARPAFLIGLATRLRQQSSPAEIQLVAQTCLSLMPTGGNVFGPKKTVGPRPEEVDQSKLVWDALNKYSFVHLDRDTCVIFVDPPNVTFSWGGALPGHWGILVLGSPDRVPEQDQVQSLQFADGIILFRGQ